MFNSRSGLLAGLCLLCMVGCFEYPSGEVPPEQPVQTTPSSEVLGPEGGRLVFESVTLDVPRGSLAEPVALSVSRRVLDSGATTQLSAVYEFGPAGTRFAIPATVRITLASANASAKLFRGESGTSTFSEVTSTTSGTELSAPITGFSFYFAGLPPPLPGGSFVVDGEHYSADPVARGVVEGLSYSTVTGLGVDDGFGGGGRVWYSPRYCMSVRMDGTGVLDVRGGAGSVITAAFPHVPYALWPEGPTRLPVLFEVYGVVLEPGYQRDADRVPFRWGVRLNPDGSVYRNSAGRHQYRFTYDDPARGGILTRAEWTPGVGPSAFDPLTTDGADRAPFCSFRESRVADPTGGLRCYESPAQYAGVAATRRHCYVRGERTGDYSIKSAANAALFEVGRYEHNRPVGEWSIYQADGSLKDRGLFSAQGVVMGPWRVAEADNAYHVMPFAGTLSRPLANYATMLHGSYERHRPTSDGGVYKALIGQYRNGNRWGLWTQLSVAGCVEKTTEYDDARQIGSSQVCARVDGGEVCIPRTESAIVKETWFGLCSGPGIREKTYGPDGGWSMACFSINPGCTQPSRGAPTPCPSVCPQ